MSIYRRGVAVGAAVVIATALTLLFYPADSQPKSLTKISNPQTTAKTQGLSDSLKSTATDTGLGTSTISVQGNASSLDAQISSGLSSAPVPSTGATATDPNKAFSASPPSTSQPLSPSPQPSPAPEPAYPPCNGCTPGAGRACPMTGATETYVPICSNCGSYHSSTDYLACRLE